MWDMAKHSMVLFAQGRLFKDVGSVILKSIIGILLTAAIFVGLVLVGLHIYASAVIAALIGGFIQPYLFKDLKYA